MYAGQGEGTEKQYYVINPHGDVVQLTDEAGSVIKTYEYDSFGNEMNPEKKDENPFRYCGEYYDKETEEIYLRARNYQPAVGRFATRDTYTGEEDDPLSLHLYTYCENDGVNAWDPSGHDAIWLPSTPNNIVKNITGTDSGIMSSEGRGYKADLSNCKKEIDKAIKYVDAAKKEGLKVKAELYPNGIKYDKYIYFRGNFKRSYRFLRKIKNKKNEKYNTYTLFDNNCKNVVVRALKKGAYFGVQFRFINSLNDAEKKLRPNDAYKIMNNFVNTKEIITQG